MSRLARSLIAFPAKWTVKGARVPENVAPRANPGVKALNIGNDLFLAFFGGNAGLECVFPQSVQGSGYVRCCIGEPAAFVTAPRMIFDRVLS